MIAALVASPKVQKCGRDFLFPFHYYFFLTNAPYWKSEQLHVITHPRPAQQTWNQTAIVIFVTWLRGDWGGQLLKSMLKSVNGEQTILTVWGLKKNLRLKFVWNAELVKKQNKIFKLPTTQRLIFKSRRITFFFSLPRMLFCVFTFWMGILFYTF